MKKAGFTYYSIGRPGGVGWTGLLEDPRAKAVVEPCFRAGRHALRGGGRAMRAAGLLGPLELRRLGLNRKPAPPSAGGGHDGSSSKSS